MWIGASEFRRSAEAGGIVFPIGCQSTICVILCFSQQIPIIYFGTIIMNTTVGATPDNSG